MTLSAYSRVTTDASGSAELDDEIDIDSGVFPGAFSKVNGRKRQKSDRSWCIACAGVVTRDVFCMASVTVA